jgi:hypothetical protein
VINEELELVNRFHFFFPSLKKNFFWYWIDANVFLSIYGDDDKLERRQLKESLDETRNLFEAGATNRFQIYAPDVGKVKI